MKSRFVLTLSLLSLCGNVAAQTSRIDDARHALAVLSARQQAVAAQAGANRSQLSRLLGALQLFGRDPPPALLVSPADVVDAVRGEILIGAIAPQLQARALRLSLAVRDLARVRRQVATAEGELFAAESGLADRTNRLEGVASEAESLIPPAARAATAAVQRGPAPTSLLAPVAGEIVSPFGARLAGGGRARGVALRTGLGAPVLSPAAGLVDYAGPLEGWGQVVILGVGGGYHVVLSGLGQLAATSGQKVALGERVGVMPTSGRDRPQLYFELRLGEAPIDPSPLMEQTRAKTPRLKQKLL
jgi:septal ring factor EnvC (AmiA/AmiB activator)